MARSGLQFAFLILAFACFLGEADAQSEDAGSIGAQSVCATPSWAKVTSTRQTNEAKPIHQVVTFTFKDVAGSENDESDKSQTVPVLNRSGSIPVNQLNQVSTLETGVVNRAPPKPHQLVSHIANRLESKNVESVARRIRHHVDSIKSDDFVRTEQRTELRSVVETRPESQVEEPSGIQLRFSDVDELSNAKPPAMIEPISTVPLPPKPQVNQAQKSQPKLAESLIVHPPIIQPYNQDQYTFVVENRAVLPATNIRLRFSVPETSQFVAVIPGSSAFYETEAVIELEAIPGGGNKLVHLTVASTKQAPVEFKVDVTATTEVVFNASDQNQPVVPSRDEIQNGVIETPMNSSGLSPYQVLVKNPYFRRSHSNYQAQRFSDQR
ncbi:MAG: hypothetical protein AAGA30_12910, partial [Planctomycetota bacterium]